MRIVLLAFVLFLSACSHTTEKKFDVPPHSKKVAIRLRDSLGVVTMYVPERYDTSFTWKDESGCTSYYKIKCRFQSKENKIYEESGFLYLAFPRDSVDQVTLVYDPGRYADRNADTGALRLVNKYFIEKIRAEGLTSENILIDTCFFVHDRLFSVTGKHCQWIKTGTTFYEVHATSVVRGEFVRFEFNMLTTKTDSLARNFTANALKTINTIRFSERF